MALFLRNHFFLIIYWLFVFILWNGILLHKILASQNLDLLLPLPSAYFCHPVPQSTCFSGAFLLCNELPLKCSFSSCYHPSLYGFQNGAWGWDREQESFWSLLDPIWPHHLSLFRIIAPQPHPFRFSLSKWSTHTYLGSLSPNIDISESQNWTHAGLLLQKVF